MFTPSNNVFSIALDSVLALFIVAIRPFITPKLRRPAFAIK